MGHAVQNSDAGHADHVNNEEASVLQGGAPRAQNLFNKLVFVPKGCDGAPRERLDHCLLNEAAPPRMDVGELTGSLKNPA